MKHKLDWRKWGGIALNLTVGFTFGYSSNTIINTYISSPPEVVERRVAIPHPTDENVFVTMTKEEYDSLRAVTHVEKKENGSNIDRKRGGRK
jgi:hypothetical protein